MAGSGGARSPSLGRKSKWPSPLPLRRARIEIIPLIDVMFFLLASFMMATLSMEKMETIRLNLPEARGGQRDVKPDMFNIGIDPTGKTYLGKEAVPLSEIIEELGKKFRANTNLAVYVTGDSATLHGEVVRVLNAVRGAGVQRVAFAVSAAK